MANLQVPVHVRGLCCRDCGVETQFDADFSSSTWGWPGSTVNRAFTAILHSCKSRQRPERMRHVSQVAHLPMHILISMSLLRGSQATYLVVRIAKGRVFEWCFAGSISTARVLKETRSPSKSGLQPVQHISLHTTYPHTSHTCWLHNLPCTNT